MAPASAAMAVRDGDVLHVLRDAKATAGSRLRVSVYGRLPELVARAGALLLQAGGASEKPGLLHLMDFIRKNGQVAKLVLKLDEVVRLSR